MKTVSILMLTAALQLATFWGTNGELASKAPCRPGFSQSFYSVLISRDVLQGQSIFQGKVFNFSLLSFSGECGSECTICSPL
ncbi:hypothetical protein J4Q44_G00261590 [Coregonus suidteri]|uniref:Uncharacterized protein n=1 Tax=Coregonus suidteri TaxID=861788 RepID=A0AAN8L7L9_9TELE